MNGRITDS